MLSFLYIAVSDTFDHRQTRGVPTPLGRSARNGGRRRYGNVVLPPPSADDAPVATLAQHAQPTQDLTASTATKHGNEAGGPHLELFPCARRL